ncbi:hypothetical protein DYB32_009757 [Aphanomyces invadans]|uniref:FAD-binding FR-type domain-containing protein n=1 Tax=Aphanomyces invadans TaxID=157072 RepID=A0A418AHU9_9STRA|nr:hypothetical protein DYB32_009757 [Aphanomyces invadans]
MAPGCADEAMGLEDCVEPWLMGHWAALAASSVPASTEGILGLATPTHVVIVCSTTGNGDPPTNAEKFWRFLKKKAHPRTLLQHVRFSVLALGDTNYDKFWNLAAFACTTLVCWGLTHLWVEFADGVLGCADEAMGLEDMVEPYVLGLWSVLLGSGLKNSVASSTIPAEPTAVVADGVESQAVLPIASEGAPDTSLDILTYLTAYSTMFPADLVPSVDPGRLPRFQDATVTVAFDTSSQVPKDIQACIAARSDFMATITRAKYLTTPSSTDRKVLWLELDTAGMGTHQPFDVSLRCVCPRYYSIASSPLSQPPDRVHIACTVVEYTLPVQGSSTGYLRRRGLCTSWLEELAQPLLATCAVPLSKKLTVPIFHHPTKDFTLPANPSYPLILVGPGTGVAPFVGFAQHRQLQHADDSESCGYWRGSHAVELVEDEFVLGPIDVFFGCRDRSQDFLFQPDSSKPHDLATHGAAVYNAMVNQGGYLFVCGDGMRMAKDVHDALVQVFVDHGKMPHDAAVAAWKDLALRQRYVRDIWG